MENRAGAVANSTGYVTEERGSSFSQDLQNYLFREGSLAWRALLDQFVAGIPITGEDFLPALQRD
jgi:hypothetical protein